MSTAELCLEGDLDEKGCLFCCCDNDGFEICCQNLCDWLKEQAPVHPHDLSQAVTACPSLEGLCLQSLRAFAVQACPDLRQCK